MEGRAHESMFESSSRHLGTEKVWGMILCVSIVYLFLFHQCTSEM